MEKEEWEVEANKKEKRQLCLLLPVYSFLPVTFTIIDTRVMHTLLSEDSLDRVFVLLSL